MIKAKIKLKDSFYRLSLSIDFSSFRLISQKDLILRCTNSPAYLHDIVLKSVHEGEVCAVSMEKSIVFYIKLHNHI